MVTYKNNPALLSCLLIIIFISSLLNLKIVNADVLDIEHNKKRISEILKVLEKEYELSSNITRNDELCWSLFHDMQMGENVEHISPVSEAERYEDLDWERYFPDCQSERYDITYSYNPKIWDAVKDWPEEKREKVGKKFTRIENFKLYAISEINDKVLLYAEKEVSDDKKIIGNGGYVWINTSNCKTDSGMPTHDSYDYFRKTPLENYNGVIRYKGNIYTYDLWQSTANSTRYSFKIYGFEKNGIFGPFCSIRKKFEKGDKK